MNDAAKQLVDELLGDLDDRSGFDTGLVDPRAMDEWRERWEAMVSRALSAARAEGYARAREQAEQRILKRCCEAMRKHGHCEHQPCDYYQNALTDIRVMQDGTAMKDEWCRCPTTKHIASCPLEPS